MPDGFERFLRPAVHDGRISPPQYAPPVPSGAAESSAVAPPLAGYESKGAMPRCSL